MACNFCLLLFYPFFRSFRVCVCLCLVLNWKSVGRNSGGGLRSKGVREGTEHKRPSILLNDTTCCWCWGGEAADLLQGVKRCSQWVFVLCRHPLVKGKGAGLVRSASNELNWRFRVDRELQFRPKLVCR